MTAARQSDQAVRSFVDLLPADLLPEPTEGILKAIQSQQLPVKDLQANLFPTTPAGGTYLSNFLQNTLKSNQLDVNTENRTLRPIAKLKEPRELFALPKELDCPLQAARWPTECQVFEERVQHIDYTPIEPEPYYQATGREVQPKPVGEEAGIVVFQYHPMSAVNYFSRSSVGGSRYFLPAIPADRDGEDELRFESRFESGNLAKVVKVTDTYYELYLRTDLYTNRHMQWFYFKVFNTKTNVNYRFSLVNLSKGDSLYSFGMKPLMYSTKDAKINGVGWHRFGENITYFRNDPTNGDEETANYTLTFNVEFQYERDDVYIAHCYPYTYSDLQDYLNQLQNHPIKSTFTKLRLLCRTLAGNNVYYLTITAPSIGDEPKRKKAVVITARVHPGETPASWMMKGFMDFLTGDSEQAKELREKFIFKLVPMLNPDGVIVGNNRCSLTGRDLNRQYRTVIRETYPPVWHTKLMIRRLMEECGIVMYCDLHAHSRKHNVFIYGCENKRYVEKRLQEQVFPLMLHKNAADKNCKFRIQRSKEGTGRVVVWMMGVANSYTMEASFAGSTMGSRLDTHFTAQDFETMGRSFCETLLDFCDEEPSKEKLRTKIIERLVKEGSSADEPTNITLSDYSSDEGDTSSSSADEFGVKREKNIPWNGKDGDCCHSLPVPPPSPQLTKRDQKDKKRDAGSPKKKSTVIQERSPPPPRRPLQVHRTTIDPPAPPGEPGDSSGVDSCDDSVSWPKAGQTGHRGRAEGRLRRARTKHMPPELIVTQAQQSSPEAKLRSRTGVERGRSKSWHQSRSRPQHREANGEVITGSPVGLSGALRRKIWTGCACNAVHSDTALSRDSTMKKAQWSKGPLSWNPGTTTGTSEALLRSCSQKLIALQKITTKLQTSEEEFNKGKLKKRKPWQKKLARNSKTDDEHVIITDWTELIQKSSKKKTNNGNKSAGTVSSSVEPTTQMTIIQSGSRRSSKQLKQTADSSSSKLSQHKSHKFRTGGMVAAAISNYRTESADSESESELQEKSVKKKKKRKVRIIKKPKRAQSAKTTSQNKN